MADIPCCTNVQTAPKMLFSQAVGGDKRIALTFDDGPSGSGSTDQVLDLLDRFL